MLKSLLACYVIPTQAQQLHIEGKMAEAEKKGNLAKWLGIATYISAASTVCAGVAILIFLVSLFNILGYY